MGRSWQVGTSLLFGAAAAFEINKEDTTPWGPAWADTILSSVADFVNCHGSYALCFYSQCTNRATAGDWIENQTTTADCPCEVHKGLYMVMINAILDKDLWKETRAACPMGSLSCKLPNSAPICKKINSGEYFPGADIISAFGINLADGNPFSTTDCGSGPFAGCMTAPCKFSEDKKTASCECPVYNGLFQVQARNKCSPGEGMAASGFRYLSAPAGSEQLYALYPSPSCTGKVQICYESTKEQLLQLGVEDQISCVGQKATLMKQGLCKDVGYAFSLGKDPVFTTIGIYSQTPAVTPPTEVLERCEQRSKTYSLTGKKALIVVTSHDVLGNESCTSCKKTGAASPEMTVPYLIFQDAGVQVEIVTIKGGDVPVDSVAKWYTHWDTRFWRDPDAVQATIGTRSVEQVTFTDYDLVYMVGGWGAAWDLGISEALGKGITEAFAAGKILGSVCHGALGFINAKKPDGSLLVTGKKMSGVTDRQVIQLGIGKITPMHPETELRKRGAIYEASHGLLTDLDQSYVAVDGTLVTGQNQNSACETAQRMLDQIEAQNTASLLV